MKNKTIRFLQVSLIFVSILCVGIFLFLAAYMNQKSAGTISEVGNIYMSGMNERILLHFRTTIEMRLSHVEDLERLASSTMYQDNQKLREELSYNAMARGFSYLGLYSQDGDFDMLYGAELEVIDTESFLKSLRKGCAGKGYCASGGSALPSDGWDGRSDSGSCRTAHRIYQ